MKNCRNFIGRNFLAIGALGLFACSENTSVAHDGATEDTNANVDVLWDFSGNLNRWHFMESPMGKISAVGSNESLRGQITWESDADTGLNGVGISLDLVDEGESSKDLSKDRGVCITYSSDFDLDLQLDFGEETNAALQNHVPGFHLYSTMSKLETVCKRWDDLMQDTEKYPVGPEVLTDVVSFRLNFYGEPGKTGTFVVGAVTRYKEPVDSYGESGEVQVDDSSESLVAKSFLWDETVDTHVRTGSPDSTAGKWFYNYGPEEWDYEIFGFNIVNENLDGTNVGVWRGLCVSFYSEEDYFKIVLDVSGKDSSGVDNSWYVDVEGKAKRHWVRIPWESFKPNNPDGEKFETAVTHASRIYFKKDEYLKLHVYKIGSYDQCEE